MPIKYFFGGGYDWNPPKILERCLELFGFLRLPSLKLTASSHLKMDGWKMRKLPEFGARRKAERYKLSESFLTTIHPPVGHPKMAL